MTHLLIAGCDIGVQVICLSVNNLYKSVFLYNSNSCECQIFHSKAKKTPKKTCV